MERPAPKVASWCTLLGASVAYFMAFYNTTAVNVALSAIQDEFQLGLADLQWFVNLYAIALGLLLVTGGRLADIFGRRWIFALGMLASMAASAVVALAPSEGVLFAGRIVQGLGNAAMLPAALALIPTVFAADHQARALGIWGAITAAGTAIAPLIGGILVQGPGWEWIFWLDLPLGAIALALVVFATPESRNPQAEPVPDVAGLAMLTLGVVALVFGLHVAGDTGWDSPSVLIAFGVGLAALVALPAVEGRARNPMINFALLRSRRFVAALLASFALSFELFGVLFFESLYLLNVIGASPVDTGLALMPMTVTMAALSIWAGRLTERFGARWSILFGLVLVIVSLGLQSTVGPRDGPSSLVFPLLVMGVGAAFVFTPAAHAAMRALPPRRSGVASGYLVMARQMGSVFGIAALGAVFAAFERSLASDRLIATADRPAFEGLLSGGPDARRAVDALPQEIGARIQREAQDVINSALDQTLLVAAVVAVISLIAFLALSWGRPHRAPVSSSGAPADDAARPPRSSPAGDHTGSERAKAPRRSGAPRSPRPG